MNFCSMILAVMVATCWITVTAIELRANCGFPGKPYRSKIVPEEKLVYEEGETVSYQCSDYWAPPQIRKCVNGVWVGSLARCGDFVMDLVMRDAKIFDMSSGLPIEKFHFRKMNLTGNSDNRNNAFSSDRFVGPGLKVTYNHEYIWKFNFSRPSVKLFVKVNFNFINFTLLDPAIRNSFSFYIDVEISPYRTCNLEYQSNNPWRDQGTRIDSFFTCEAHSYHDLGRDIENPPNYMIMRTKSSHNILHELVELFFGHVYGNETEPICGEPEIDFGQSSRAVQEFRDYNIECLNDKEWKDITPNSYKHYVYNEKCIGDMIWNGTRPRCIPIRTCPIQNILNQNRANHHHHNNPPPVNDTENPLVIEAVNRYYNFIDNQTIFAIVGTEIVYSCASVDYILIGKDTRTCRRDMTWSGTEPVCKYIKTTPEVVESTDYLFIIIICMTILIFLILAASGFLFFFCTKHWHITSRKNYDPNVTGKDGTGAGGQPTGGDWQSENYYDNIEMNFNHPAKNDVFYDIYETVDSNKDHHHRFPGTDTGVPAGTGGQFPFNEQTALNSNKENDYIRMFGALKVEHPASVLPVVPAVPKESSPGRNKPKTLREPSYLEVMQ